MSYKIIEKNEYGVRVRNYSGIPDCNLCKYVAEKSICNRIECAPNSYYLPDSEVEKLETELTPETFTINDMYVAAKTLFDCQDQLKDLQIENKQLKERIKKLESKIKNEIKRFECGTDDLVVFKYLIENKVKVMRYDNEILTVINITELQSYPILMSNYEKYSKNGFFKNFTNIDGTEFFYD